jgi:lipid A 4'-phosphatase
MIFFWIGFLIAMLGLTAFWPQLDLAVTTTFYAGDAQFPVREWRLAAWLHDFAAGWPPKLMALFLIIGLGAALLKRHDRRSWLYLLLTLLLGPGLLANLVLKDQWGRARPLQITQFGGEKVFTPWWQPTTECQKNCSFIGGDASLGAALAAPALLMQRRRRFVFWALSFAGTSLGLMRVMSGAHFFSDTMAAFLLMPLVSLAIYALVYGRAAARNAWRDLR